MAVTLTIGLAQYAIAWEQPQQNHLVIEAMMEQASQIPDILVLPEMFSTGFTMNPNLVAESMDGISVSWMRSLASRFGMGVAGSLSIREENRFVNRFVFIHPDGRLQHYDKRHLFSLAGEDKVYSAGNSREIVKFRGFRINLQICYDLRFPAFSRFDNDYDLLFYVANWPEPRISAWDVLLQARAIENMCFVVGVNRVGIDANAHNYPGHSVVLGPLGEVLADAGSEQKLILTSIDLDSLRHHRDRFGFLEDRDEITVS